MKRYLSFGALFAGLALFATSCFSMQAFSVLDSSLSPGQATKAQFTLRPFDADGGATTPNRVYQFVMVGVDNTADLSVGKATWGTNGKFGGPTAMGVSSSLPAILTTGTTCSSSALGIDLSGTSTTWKAFVTTTMVNDKNAVDQTAVVQVGLKAKAGATSTDFGEVTGVTGGWKDNTSGGTVGVPDATDSFFCTGMGAVSYYIK